MSGQKGQPGAAPIIPPQGGSGTAPPQANTRQVGGEHYRTQKIQHWDYVAANDLDYFQGQITKYVSRWKQKNGIQDLEKAAHFLQKYIELVRKGMINDDNRVRAAGNADGSKPGAHPEPTGDPGSAGDAAG